MNKIVFLLIGIISSVNIGAQTFQAKLMSWNILNFPSSSAFAADTAQRCPAYRIVINYAQPDILITCENAYANGIPVFLNQVMNTGPYHYAAGTFINGYDTDNAIYYRDSLFTFISNHPINTALRDINCFTLVYKATGDTIRVFSCHLKAGQGFESQREGEVLNLRQFTNALPAGTNFFIGGDFNIYESAEPAYVELLRDNPGDDGNFIDVLNMTGLWNNFSYRYYHTQSTHYSAAGNFSYGGMDDRFDMILFSNGVQQQTGVYYVPGSYHNIGNDGNHYNDAINYGTNTAVGQAVADALFDASDHLPVMLTMMFGTPDGVDELPSNVISMDIIPMPVDNQSIVQLSLKKKSRVQITLSDVTGRIILENEPNDLSEGLHNLPVDWDKLGTSGFYFLSVKTDNSLISRKIIVIK
jgi:hypothetical protein